MFCKSIQPTNETINFINLLGLDDCDKVYSSFNYFKYFINFCEEANRVYQVVYYFLSRS